MCPCHGSARWGCHVCTNRFHLDHTRHIAEPKSDEWYFDVAKSVYRTDIYAIAAQELISEGLMSAGEFPDFETETGFKPEQTEFLDGVSYGGSKPNGYLQKLAIGLKEEVL